MVDLLLTLVLAAAAPPPPSLRGAPPGAGAPDHRDLRRRTLTLTDATVDVLPEVHVARGTATVLTFQTDIAADGVTVGSVREKFYPIAQAARMVLLSPREDLGEAVPLNVALTDGTILTFKLVSVRADVDVQVDVVVAFQRRASADSAAALKATISTLRMQLDECQSTAGDAGGQKLAALLLGQSLDTPQVFDRRQLRALQKDHRLLVEARWAYRLLGLTYVVLTIENRDPDGAWTLARAAVTAASSSAKSDIRVTAVATEVPSLPPDQSERVVVAFPTPSAGVTQSLVITLYERDGGRSVALPAMDL